MKQQFLKNRRSGDFGGTLLSDGIDTIGNSDDVFINTKVATLDPGPVADGIQNNLRPLLRNKYGQLCLGDTEESFGSDWGTWGREGGGKIKHFGMIDQPPLEDIQSCHSLQYNTRYISLAYFNNMALTAYLAMIHIR